MESTHDAVRRPILANLDRPRGQEAELIAAQQGPADADTLRLVAQGARTEADHGSWTYGHVTAARLEQLAQWLDTQEAARERIVTEDAIGFFLGQLRYAVEKQQPITITPAQAAAMERVFIEQTGVIAGRMADAGLVAAQAQKGLEAATEYNRQLKGVVNDLLEQVEAVESKGQLPKLRFSFVAVEGELEPGDLGIELGQELALALDSLHAKGR